MTTRYALILILLSAGCTQREPVAVANLTRVATTGAALKLDREPRGAEEVLRKYILSLSPDKRVPPTTQPAFKKLTTLPDPNERVRVFTFTVGEGHEKKYWVFRTAAGPAGYSDVHFDPTPLAIIAADWLYVSGDAPCVGTLAVTAQAEGCRLLLYYFGPATNPLARCRVCFLEGDPNQLVWVSSITAPVEKRCLTAGTYGEVNCTDTGKFQGWVELNPVNFAHPISRLADDVDHTNVVRAVDEFRYNQALD